MLNAEALIGAWKLMSWCIEYADGRVTYPYGEQARGLLIYTGDGLMNAVLYGQNRGPVSTPSVRQAPAAEKAALFDSVMQYAGPYRIDGTDVIHHVEYALNPDLLGTQQRRHVRFEGPVLHLSGVEILDGTGTRRTHRLTWTRA
ncbi:MAG: hypothetical protein Tsb0016_25390 [Sphingomonadales bacterium]